MSSRAIGETRAEAGCEIELKCIPRCHPFPTTKDRRADHTTTHSLTALTTVLDSGSSKEHGICETHTHIHRIWERRERTVTASDCLPPPSSSSPLLPFQAAADFTHVFSQASEHLREDGSSPGSPRETQFPCQHAQAACVRVSACVFRVRVCSFGSQSAPVRSLLFPHQTPSRRQQQLTLPST